MPCSSNMIQWVENDRSLGLLPSYEDLQLCEESDDLKSLNALDAITHHVETAYPDITASAILPILNCPNISREVARKASFKGIYFLGRLNESLKSKAHSVREVDLFLNSESKKTKPIDCRNPQLIHLEDYCNDLRACPSLSVQQKDDYISEVSKIENENKLIDESTRILTKDLETQKHTLNVYRQRNPQDSIGYQNIKDKISKVSDQIAILENIKLTNLQSYPVLTHPTYLDSRQSRSSVGAAITNAFEQQRLQIQSEFVYQNEVSFCVTSPAEHGCDPDELNKTLMATPDFPASAVRSKSIPIGFHQGIQNQRCITNIELDRIAVSKVIHHEILSAGIDIALTLIPGTATFVIGKRISKAAEIGIDATKTGSKIAKTTEVVNASVGLAWLSRSSLQAIGDCQGKFQTSESNSSNKHSLCESVTFPFTKSSFNTSDCVKAVVFSAMAGLPIAGQASTYLQRTKNLNKVIQNAEITAETKKLEEARRTQRLLDLKQVNKENPQLQVWKLGEEGQLEHARQVEQAIHNELAEGKIVSHEPVVTSLGRPLGNNGARWVRYETGLEGVWKAKSPGNNTDADIAAYLIDQHLGAGNVPITVAKSLDGIEGTVQLKVKGLKDSSKVEPDELKLTDYLNGNSDRHAEGNHVQTTDGRSVGIDNGRAFAVVSKDAPTLVRNPLTSHVRDLEQNLEYIKIIESKLQKYREGSTSEAFRQQFPLKELEKDLADRQSDFYRLAQKHRDSLGRMLPSPNFISKLRNTTQVDWQSLLGKHLSAEQIQQLGQRQRDILNSYDRLNDLINHHF